jgi:hypothetical protein
VRGTPRNRIILFFFLQYPPHFFQYQIWRRNISHFAGFEVFIAVVMKSLIFWSYDPVWSVESQPMFLLATFFMLVSRLAYTSTMKAEATCSSEILVDYQSTGYTALHPRRQDSSSLNLFMTPSFSSALSTTQSCTNGTHLCAMLWPRYTFSALIVVAPRGAGAAQDENC